MKYLKYSLLLICGGGILLIAALYLIPVPEEKLHPKEAYRFYDRNDQLIGIIISEDGFFRMHVETDQIPDLLKKSLLVKEDKFFYHHFGVNPLAIFRAVVDNLAAGKVVSGGSTLTMQLARMLERRDRTIGAKLIESFRAMQLELKYTKDEILAFYLAIAPYGGNIEGVQSAAFKYFGKPASMLSVGEIALLIAIPKSPNMYRPDRHPEAAVKQRNGVLDKMLAAKLINDDQFRRSRLEKVPTAKISNKNIIPHLSWRLKGEAPKKYVWKTTIDQNIQLRTQQILKSYVEKIFQYHITNAAAVVIDNKSREILAIVGSTDYFSQKGLGANDGTYTARSPGSTLKPFLYGLGFDAGIISEKTVLYDIPINYAGYAPQNYSKDFIGPVLTREALTESLNVVAVKLSRDLGHEKLYNLLKNGGIRTLEQPSIYYGLPLVLGGVEVRLVELTNLYASLANGGVYQPYQIQVNALPSKEKARLLSPESSWLLSHILTDVERPDFPESWQFAKNRATIAWKTGTSYGQQDAWSVGYNPEFTIGVWTGNFDATPSNGLVGSKVAAPLLFELFHALKANKTKQWFAKPEKVKKRVICSLCGTIPTDLCPATSTEYYIENPNASILKERCEIPQEIVIDKTIGRQSNSETLSKNRKKKIYNIWPSKMAQFLLLHGVPVRDVPPYDIQNMAGQKYYPPKILSPVKNTVYYKRPDKFTAEQHGLKLSAAVTNRVRTVKWYMNGKFLGNTDPKEDLYINPPPGTYQIKLLDDVGGTDEVELVVKNTTTKEGLARKSR